jgi:hypothetical protein
MSKPFKLSDGERAELLAKYMDGGRKAILADCKRPGIHRSYVQKLACKEGLSRRKHKPNVSFYGESDPRWEWAKKRGAISL